VTDDEKQKAEGEAQQLTPEEQAQLHEALKNQMNLGTFKPPVCPYCKIELVQFQEKTLMFKQGLIVHVFWCWNESCRALLSMQILPPDQPQQQSRIFIPGGTA